MPATDRRRLRWWVPAIAVGLVSGLYPALFLSAFRPVQILRAQGGPKASGAFLRRALVVLQFALSVFLIIGTVVVQRQMRYMRTKALGFDKEQIVIVPLRGDTAGTDAALKDRLLGNPNILGVTATYQPPTSIGANSWGATWEGKDPEQRYLIGISWVDFDYPETMKIEMAAGRFGLGHLIDPGGHDFAVEALAITGEQGTADLDHPFPGGGDFISGNQGAYFSRILISPGGASRPRRTRSLPRSARPGAGSPADS